MEQTISIQEQASVAIGIWQMVMIGIQMWYIMLLMIE